VTSGPLAELGLRKNGGAALPAIPGGEKNLPGARENIGSRKQQRNRHQRSLENCGTASLAFWGGKESSESSRMANLGANCFSEPLPSGNANNGRSNRKLTDGKNFRGQTVSQSRKRKGKVESGGHSELWGEWKIA